MSFLRYAVCAVLCIALLVGLCGTAEAIGTSASSAILMDAESGRILYEQNIHERRLIASTTKLMTALVAAEQVENLEQKVVVQPDWVGIEGSSIYLKANETVTVRELLYGLLLHSGNDAAVAIAGCVAGGIEPFAELMNRRAVELGMTDSRFTNPSGLNDENHYSTAYDMARLACACLKNEVVAEICATQSAVFGEHIFRNHNKLLRLYDGCVGMKTGYTELAGRTLVSAATRNGQTLVCVTLNDADDWNDHVRLLNYGFDVYPSRILCEENELFGRVRVAGSLLPILPVKAAKQVRYPLRAGESLSLKVEIAGELQAPVERGEPVGWILWLQNGEVVAKTELLCAGSAEKNLRQKKSMTDWLLRGCSLLLQA